MSRQAYSRAGTVLMATLIVYVAVCLSTPITMSGPLTFFLAAVGIALLIGGSAR